MDFVEEKQKNAMLDAMKARREVLLIGNSGRMHAVYAEDSWEPLEMQDALRSYGLFVSTICPAPRHTPLLSLPTSTPISTCVLFDPRPPLTFLQSKFPWFSLFDDGDNNKTDTHTHTRLEKFLTAVERYIVNVNTTHFFSRIVAAIDSIIAAGSNAAEASKQWQLLVPLLRQTIPPSADADGSGGSSSGN